MPDQSQPTNPENSAPDPATAYERAKPEKEAGMGRLDNNPATPEDAPDREGNAVHNVHPSRQINADDAEDERKALRPGQSPAAPEQPIPEQPDHSMHEEEPMDTDLAPANIHDPRAKRHPRKEGKGGVP